MAQITGKNEERTYQISTWLGVNENPDGDIRLKMGEAAEMRNFRITRDGSLQIRPGTRTLSQFDGPVGGLWSGTVNGARVVVCAADGKLWRLNMAAETRTEIGTLGTAGGVSFFGFSGRLYVLNGTDYLCWDGGEAMACSVTGYRPLVSTAVPPGGGGTAVESVNKLNGLRHCYFSPDGTAAVFQLPETGLASVDFVKNRITGEAVDAADYTVDLEAGTVTFPEAPDAGINTLDVGYAVAESDRAKITAMRFAETYNGTTDNRVFLYGDGTNQTVYSGLTEAGEPTAEYFPDLNVIAVGESNTPVTGLIRHLSRLIAYKPDSAWSIYYGQITLESGALTAGFYLSPINRAVGNAAPGQCCLVTNHPRTLHGGGCYEWKPAYSSLTNDERQAQRISRRVGTTLSEMALSEACAFDDDYNQCYYIVQNGVAAVHNYAQDVWSIYRDFPVICMASFENKLYAGTSTGRVVHISRQYRNDDGAAIDAFWRSGSMGFDREWRRKSSATIWVTVRPESNARVTVTARSDRKADYAEKVVSSGLAGFAHVDFGHFSFGTNRRSRVYRERLKVKKFALYQLIFKSNSASASATVLSVDLAVRYSGNVK